MDENVPLRDWLQRFCAHVTQSTLGREVGPLRAAHEIGESPEEIAELALTLLQRDDEGGEDPSSGDDLELDDEDSDDLDDEDDPYDDDDGRDDDLDEQFRAVWREP